jgi:hypothetical protein
MGRGLPNQLPGRRRLTRLVSVSAAGLLLALALPAVASHSIMSFVTPQRAAYCKLVVSLEESQPFTPELFCFTPNDGFTLTLRASGRPKHKTLRANKWWYPPNVIRVLRFGQSWWGNADGYFGASPPRGDVLYRCWSRRTGLTCRNRANHGFWLGRFKSYRTF